MAKIQYMVTEEYVRDWTALEALREILANGVDAEVQQSAPLNVRHDARKKILYVRNDRAHLDVKALYFGGTTKAGDERLVGQFGEGLKLALLVFARAGIPVVVRNGDEDWSVAMEPDERGVKVLTLYTRKSRSPSSGVEVEVGQVSSELWEQAQGMFLRLLPPIKTFATERGEILTDPERVGNYYVRGVFIAHRDHAAFGYNFAHLDVGRDRRSYDVDNAQYEITSVWNEAVTKYDVGEALFDAMRKGAKDLAGFRWYNQPSVVEQIVKRFKALYGEKALPVTGTAEVEKVEHLGFTGVILPDGLVACLRRGMPSVDALQAQAAREIKERHGLEVLEPVERDNFLGAMDLMAATGCDLTERVIVATFGDDSILGLHHGKEIYVGRKNLRDFGETLGVLIHEASHDVAGDGTNGHVLTMHLLTARAFTALRSQIKKGQ